MKTEVFPSRRSRTDMKEGAGSPTTTVTPSRPPRPRSTSYTTSPLDLSPLSPSPSSPSRLFSTRPHTPPLYWGSHPASPVGLIEGLEEVRTPGCHSRLPSTDSGIQADAGWDSLGRAHAKALGKVSTDITSTSPDCRTPLKTLTRCLMESRAAGKRASWGEPSTSTNNGRSLSPHFRSSPRDAVLPGSPAARQRTMSWDTDTSPTSRMVSSFPSSAAHDMFHTPHRTSRAPTTTGEVDQAGGRDADWKGGGSDSFLSRSVDSALSTALATAMVSGVNAATLGADHRPATSTGATSQRVGARSDRFGVRLEQTGQRADQTGVKSDCPSVQSEYSGSRLDKASSRYSYPSATSAGMLSTKTSAVPLLTATRLTTPSTFTSSSALTSSTLPRRTVNISNRSPATPVTLLSSSTPVVLSQPSQDPDRRMLPQADECSWRGRQQLRVSQPVRDSAVNGSRLPKFRLTSPTVSAGSPPRTDRGLIHGSSGSGAAAQAVSHHFKPRVTPLSVARLVNSTQSSSSKILGAQARDHRPASCDSAKPVTAVSVSDTHYQPHVFPGSEQLDGSKQSPHLSRPLRLTAVPPPVVSKAIPCVAVTAQADPTPPENATDPQPPAGPVSSLPSLIPVSNSHSVSTTTMTTSNAMPHDVTTHSQPTSATSSLSVRPRHISPIFRSKLSPVLPRNMLHTKIPISSSPSSHATPTNQGRRIPVKHVDTCSACLKPGSSPSASDVSLKDNPSPTIGSDLIGPYSKINIIPVMAGSPSSCDHLKTVVDTAPSPMPEGVLQLVQRSSAVAGDDGKRIGAGGGGAGVVVNAEGERTIPVVDVRKEVPWKERRSRIDSALVWLRGELECLRAMDTALMMQFRRCQDTIETLKQQHELSWGDWEGSEWGWGLDGSELDEEEETWEDWEIAEFERKWAQDPETRELDITLLPVTSSGVFKTNGVTASDPAVKGSKAGSPFKQDVEATL